MPAATRFIKGTITCDGTGAATVDTVTTGYKCRKVNVRSIAAGGGTVVVRDNAGAGANTLASVTLPGAFGARSTATIVSPLRITVAGAGAGRVLRYQLVLDR